MSAPKVFLSVGRTSNDRQETLVQTIEKFLQANELVPQTVGRTYFSSKQPLVAIAELMHECAGSIILAYERIHLIKAVEKRGSPHETRIEMLNLPTVWNQIEATMAYTLGHPLLVIVEEGMKYEGLLERGYDWYVKQVKLEDDLLSDVEFLGVFADWKRRVVAFQAQLQKETVRRTNQQQQVPHNLLVSLRRILAERFSAAELQMLCFDLGVNYDDLGANEHGLKALQLVQTLERTNRIDDLIEFGRALRPDVAWDIQP